METGHPSTQAVNSGSGNRALHCIYCNNWAACCVLKPSPSSELGEERSCIGLTDLIDTLSACCYRPERDAQGTFVFAVDHCFSIKGHGTVMTGTVVSGSVAVSDVCLYVALSLSMSLSTMYVSMSLFHYLCRCQWCMSLCRCFIIYVAVSDVCLYVAVYLSMSLSMMYVSMLLFHYLCCCQRCMSLCCCFIIYVLHYR